MVDKFVMAMAVVLFSIAGIAVVVLAAKYFYRRRIGRSRSDALWAPDSVADDAYRARRR